MASSLAIIFTDTIKKLSVNPDHYLKEWEIRSFDIEPTIPYPHNNLDWNCDCDTYAKPHYRCICTNDIIYGYMLKNKLSGHIIRIGKDCGKRYLDLIPPENICLECGRRIRKNPHNLCVKCKVLCTLNCGKKYKNETYHNIYRNDLNYCQWVVKKPRTGKLGFFYKWLILKDPQSQ